MSEDRQQQQNMPQVSNVDVLTLLSAKVDAATYRWDCLNVYSTNAASSNPTCEICGALVC